MNLTKYTFLNSHVLPSNTWTDSDLRRLVGWHIRGIKRHLGRYVNQDVSNHSFHDSRAYWLIYDLEALGKSKSAERIYIRLLALGIIEGI
jgi:hypothetical protein